MMTENLRKLLVSVAVSALLAGPALAEGDDTPVDDGGTVSVEEPGVEVDPMPEGGPDMWTGGDPDFCESCTGEPVENLTDGGGDEGDSGDGIDVDEPQVDDVTTQTSEDDVNDLGVDPNDIEPRIRETMTGGEGLNTATEARGMGSNQGGECVWTPRQMHCRD